MFECNWWTPRLDSTFGRVIMGGRFLNGQHGEAKGQIRTRFVRLGIPLASPPELKHLLFWGSFTSSLSPQLAGASHLRLCTQLCILQDPLVCGVALETNPMRHAISPCALLMQHVAL